MRTLNDVFNEAKEDTFCATLDTKYVEARLVFGVKIVRDRETGVVEIFNTQKGGDFYQEIDVDEYDYFLEKSWRFGVYRVSLSNYSRKLINIEASIKDVINDKQNKKQLDSLQSRRLNIMNRYTKITSKLNLLHNE
jgi:hypothetical protein|tara:strand:- start:107 stop:514 length:408 start_codon:yes stop_codon:yes gene_type:complete